MEWRAIYHELKRLEFRGDVRRGYFVAGHAGAQFALPEAVLVESIDGGRAGVSRWAQALLDAEYQRAVTDLRYCAGV